MRPQQQCCTRPDHPAPRWSTFAEGLLAARAGDRLATGNCVGYGTHDLCSCTCVPMLVAHAGVVQKQAASGSDHMAHLDLSSNMDAEGAASGLDAGPDGAAAPGDDAAAHKATAQAAQRSTEPLVSALYSLLGCLTAVQSAPLLLNGVHAQLVRMHIELQQRVGMAGAWCMGGTGCCLLCCVLEAATTSLRSGCRPSGAPASSGSAICRAASARHSRCYRD